MIALRIKQFRIMAETNDVTQLLKLDTLIASGVLAVDVENIKISLIKRPADVHSPPFNGDWRGSF